VGPYVDTIKMPMLTRCGWMHYWSTWVLSLMVRISLFEDHNLLAFSFQDGEPRNSILLHLFTFFYVCEILDCVQIARPSTVKSDHKGWFESWGAWNDPPCYDLSFVTKYIARLFLGSLL